MYKSILFEEKDSILTITLNRPDVYNAFNEEMLFELQDAFKEALASLTSRERNLLRYHFLEGMSIDRIGALYGVHRATAARWIQGARENLCERTRTNMCKRISLSEEGFERILGLIESQIAINLAATKT